MGCRYWVSIRSHHAQTTANPQQCLRKPTKSPSSARTMSRRTRPSSASITRPGRCSSKPSISPSRSFRIARMKRRMSRLVAGMLDGAPSCTILGVMMHKVDAAWRVDPLSRLDHANSYRAPSAFLHVRVARVLYDTSWHLGQWRNATTFFFLPHSGTWRSVWLEAVYSQAWFASMFFSLLRYPRSYLVFDTPTIFFHLTALVAY